MKTKKYVIISMDYLGELNAEGSIKLTNFAVPNSTIFNEIKIKDIKLLKDKYFLSLYEYVHVYKENTKKGTTKLKKLSSKEIKKHLKEVKKKLLKKKK